MAVALYARVSTTKQADRDLSIPDQLNQMRDWCKRNGYAVGGEYVDAGLSATDDRRPEFQRMVSEATLKPSPFDAVIVHSQSRFFRDHIEFALYERRLNKAGCKLVSITQQTSDDPSGAMARQIFSLFDEYQSKETAKHTLRAMNENARQGFFNGSRPPFGYKTEQIDMIGAKGPKKRLVIDEVEAPTVRRVFDLYLNGLRGVEMGCKQIASHFNEQGQLLRGANWTRTRVHQILCDTACCGDYIFNKKEMRTNKVKPKDEWIHVKLEPIIDPDKFALVAAKRHQRSPAITPPRITSSPTLLTGLLKCANCGAGMTTATGKGGRYRYYKCNTRIGQRSSACSTPAVSMGKIDRLVLDAFADKVLTPVRLLAILKEMKSHLKTANSRQDETIRSLQKELTELEHATNRLYEAVEKDLLPMDDMLRQRAQKLKARRETVLLDIARSRQSKEVPVSMLTAKQLETFGTVLRTRLVNDPCGAGKRYLRQLVSEIRFDGSTVVMRGKKAALLEAAAQNEKDTYSVPSSVSNWLLDLGSNQGPTD